MKTLEERFSSGALMLQAVMIVLLLMRQGGQARRHEAHQGSGPGPRLVTV